MKWNNTKLAKTERPYPPHEETKVKERRKYSVCQMELVARVEQALGIRERLKWSLKCS